MANYAQELHTSNLGMATINTANSNLDGSTGSYATVITGASNGTFVKTLIIKAQTNTGNGMIRLFAKRSGLTNNLLAEFRVLPVTKSSRDISYQNVIPLGYTLQSGEELQVSTQVADTFNIIAEGFDISYANTPEYLASSMELISNAGSGTVSTANSNLDGATGTYSTIYTAASGGGESGSVISSITIKAQQTTSPGMVRLFILDTSGLNPGVLFSEVEIPAVTQAATLQTFTCQALRGSLCIPPGYSIMASTQIAETFSVIIEGSDWKYV